MAENTYINKVVLGNDTLLDLTEDSVTENTLLEGETAHKASGEPITGTAKQGHIIWNAIKTALSPQRLKLWFADAKVTDDSTEQATKVEVVQLIDDESELTNAPDGVYQGDYEDVPEVVLDASMMAYRDGTVEDALDDLNDPKIFYKDIPIAGLQLSNYYTNVNTNVNPNEYTAIGTSDVAGAWDENLVFRTNTANTLRVLNMRTATYTVPSVYAPIRVYFVKASNVSATPLS